jgi:uncharacterized protein YycO
MKLCDIVRERLTCSASAFGNVVAHALDLRIPTANPETTAEQRQAIMDTLCPGDIILTSDTSYLLWETLEYGAAGSHFTHVCIYEGNGRVLEATVDSGVDGVMRSLLDVALSGPMKIAVIRPAYKTPEDCEAALEFCRSKLGKPYDGLFNMDQAEGASYYCSSLLYEAFQAMPNPIEVQRKRALGRWLVIPDAFLHLEAQTVVYRDQFTLWHSLKGSAPTAIGGAAATVGFHVMMAHLAPLAGFYLAISAGNKLQTGHFGLTSGPAKAGRMDPAST